MNASRLTLAIAFVATLAIAQAAGARTSFTGNVCGLLTAKQITATQGISSKCTNAKPSNGPGSKIYSGTWAGKTPTSPTALVTVTQYTDPGLLKLAKSNLKQGLPSASPSKVAGIGSAAYEASGGSSTGIRFSVGSYIALVTLNGSGKAPSASSAEGLARAIAAEL